MKVWFKEGDTIEVENNTDLVTKMRENSKFSPDTNEKYMIDYARRAVLMNNEDVRATNEEDFINDLIKLKHITITK